MNRPEEALFAFRKAQALKSDLRSYQGQEFLFSFSDGVNYE